MKKKTPEKRIRRRKPLPPKPGPTWSAVSFAGTPIGRVSSVHLIQGGTYRPTRQRRDDPYPTEFAALKTAPGAIVSTADIGAAFGFVAGSLGELEASLLDDEGRGAEFAMINAVADGGTASGGFATGATADLKFRAHSDDGHTNPLCFSAAGNLARPVPDALMIPETMKAGDDQAVRIQSILDIAEPILNVYRSAGGRAWIRRQPGGRLFVSRDRHDTIFHPVGHPRNGHPRYRWTHGLDGIEFGFLIPESSP